MENEGGESKPFVVYGKTLRVLNNKPGDWFSVVFKVLKRQLIEPDNHEDEEAEEDLDDSQAEEVEEGEEEEEPIAEEGAEGQRPRRKRRNPGRGRKKNKRKKRAPKKIRLVKADEELKLRGDLCYEITSPLFLFTLTIRVILDDRGELYYKLVSIDKAEPLHLPVSFASIKKALCKSHYFGGPNFTPVQRGKSIEQAFKTIIASDSVIVTTDEAERMLRHNKPEIRFALNNITRPECYFQLVNKVGSNVVRVMTKDEVLYFSGLQVNSADAAPAGEDADAPNGVEEKNIDEVDFFTRLCFSVKIGDDTYNYFISSVSTRKQSRAYEKIFSASKIYHELMDNRRMFLITKLVETGIDSWDKGAIDFLRKQKSSLLFVGKANSKYYVQLLEDYQRENQLAETIYNLKDLVVVDYELDDIDNVVGSYGVCVRRIIQDNTHTGKWMVVCSLPRRVHLLKKMAPNQLVVTVDGALNFVEKKSSLKRRSVKTEDLFDMSIEVTSRNILIDRAHLLSVEQIQQIVNKFSSKLGRLVLCGTSNYTPAQPGAWFSSLCRSEYSLSEQHKQSDVQPLVFPQERIDCYYPNENMVLGKIPKDKKINIFVCNARVMRVLKEILNLYGEKMLIRANFIWDIDYKNDPADFTIIATEGANRLTLVKALQCSYADKRCIGILGSPDSLRQAADTIRTPGMNNLDVLLRRKFDQDEGLDEMSDYESPVEEEQEEDENVEVDDETMLENAYGYDAQSNGHHSEEDGDKDPEEDEEGEDIQAQPEVLPESIAAMEVDESEEDEEVGQESVSILHASLDIADVLDTREPLNVELVRDALSSEVPEDQEEEVDEEVDPVEVD